MRRRLGSIPGRRRGAARARIPRRRASRRTRATRRTVRARVRARGGIFLGARSLLTRATVSAAVCATRRAASAAASAATRRVLAAAAAATASSRRRRASSVSTRAVCASARRRRARSTASRATRSRLGSRGARGGGSGCAARGSRSERRRASGRCGWRDGSGRGASPRRLGAGRSPRAEECFGAGMVLVEAAAVAVAAARVFARVASLDMRARRASASARRRASSLRTRGGFEGGRCSTGTSSSRWSVTTKPRSPSPVSIQDGTRFGSPARMSRRVRDAPRRASPRARARGIVARLKLSLGGANCESPENLKFGKLAQNGGRSDLPPLHLPRPRSPAAARVSPPPHTARARDTHVRRASFRLDGRASSSRLSGPPRASRHVDRRCPRAWRSARRAPAAEADASDHAGDAPRGRRAPRDDRSERR